ncbi:MAG: hypothetical protein MUC51_10075 [Anaerolineae bacterium]|jgi:hypothetical protein|nr:hypothetical protein [Anaerolineae bacterium]
MNRSGKSSYFDSPGRYRIRVLGQLSASWIDQLETMTITAGQATGLGQVTTLMGEMRDQAALMGVLNSLYDLGFPLLRVERLWPPLSGEGLDP